MIEAVLKLNIPTHWIFEISKRFDASIKILDRKPYSKNGVSDLVEITVSEDKLNELLETIKELPTVHNVDLSITDKGKAVGSVASKCFACKSLAGSDCFLVSARSNKEGNIEWTIIFSKKNSLQKLIKKLETYGIDVEMSKINELDDKKALTARQVQIIQLAFEMGYFEYPRRISLSELAGKLNISKSTLTEILRKGQEKIMVDYFRKKA